MNPGVFAYAQVVLIALMAPLGAFAGDAGFSKFAAATVHPLATDAAMAAYQRGGNAVDAAVAAALTLGVVDGHNSGIGGGCFIVIRAANGDAAAIDGRETAPAAASRDMFVKDGKVDDEASKTGALASGVPGALRAYDLALKKYGHLHLADLLKPAAELAEKGFAIDEAYARRIAATAGKMKRFPATAAIFFKADGSPLAKGDRLVQVDLAATYRAVAMNGSDAFYLGEFAHKTEAWMHENGGLMTAADLAAYRAVERTPIRSRYRGYDLISMPPPSSGGVHVAQILNILERFPVAQLSAADRVHVMTEAMKFAFADRAFWLGDPDFVKVPRGLVDPDYAADLARKIDPSHSALVPSHGMPPRWEGDVYGKHTTHLSTADAEGNWVALTQTVNTAFGSKVIIPGTGVILNNQMDDFSVQPGVPNAFKLVGGDANAIAPGKRPLSSMSPTLVLHEGQPMLSAGAAGGPTIITQTVLLISNILDRHMEPGVALMEPRFHHQWAPDQLKIEARFDAATLNRLEMLGHKLDKSANFGACQCVMRGNDGKQLIPAHDPRVAGKADGL